ncbi:hypothetical protein C5167_031968 [Papaver somniferum]|uniref:Uncharacterized protein n=1 Tax=Papaver somniferum TaxID=3469 RepID=A0A4Y7K912_PAPSO|nr:hypothetical protein C5167_031968 [Papaver somniferum]
MVESWVDGKIIWLEVNLKFIPYIQRKSEKKKLRKGYLFLSYKYSPIVIKLIIPLGYPNFKDFQNSNLRWKMANKNEQPAPTTSSSEGTYHIERKWAAHTQKKRRRHATTTDSNTEGLYAKLQEQADDRVQVQDDQIRAQNEVIKTLKEHNKKFTRNMQILMGTLGLNNITASGINGS